MVIVMKKIILISVCIIFAVFAFSKYSSAQTVDELNAQINNANSQIEQINIEIKALSGQIAVTGEQKNTLANAIKDLTLRRSLLTKEREQTEKKITATGLVIQTLDSEIVTRNDILSRSKNSLASLLKDLHQQDQQTFLQKLLLNKNLGDLSREYNNIVSLNTEIDNNISNVNTQKESLTITKDNKEEEKNTLTTLKMSLTAKEQEIESNKKEKDTLLAATKNKESNYKMLLLEQQKRMAAFEKSLEDYESQLKFILNPKSIPKEGSTALSWPLNTILITSPYGSRWGKFHYGLDFRAPIGSSVKAMTSGVVEGTGDTDIACKGASFGKWVFIRYNDGLSSTYGHLSSITATVGQKVNAGDVVALSGNTGSSTGPHLHVAVYASGGVNVATVPSKACNGKIFTQPISALSAYLDPGLYLPTITASMVKK
jgi:murein DD-endopeptidase MepM/ murein hydrolase activator NlpD